MHVRKNTYGSYPSLPWGTSQELNHSRGPGVSHRDYFRATGMIFPKVTFTLDGMLRRHMGQYFAIGSE
jgi:hypothetical protein